MRRRVLTALLALCMAVSLLPVHALAVDVAAGSGLDTLGIRQISEKKYAVTPDVTEYEWILNNASLTQQMMGHVMEVKVGTGSTASLALGYSDYNIKTIQSGRNWAMLETTKQAQSMQTRRGENVVGAINAGGYDMSNGRPSGAFVMNGVAINRATATTFWVDMDGKAHITDAQTCNAALDAGNVREAVAGFGDIFENGHARSGLDNTTRASRTAIGIKADGTVVMLMVDGRQAPYSVGMTMAEVAASMEALGCVEAVNLDGGGSSTFATQREGEPENETTAGLTLRCRPSDGYERKVSNTIMVLSNAQPTGTFDHAVLTPNNEVYTPGSTVPFTAAGVDAAGVRADIPAGTVWTVLSGSGTINATTGLYTAGDTCGEVTVGLQVNGKIVGQTAIQIQWPDKLDFTNSSVSIDFGETSDLTFKPTWQGREVRYKDGDFAWSIDENDLSYKHTVKLEQYYTPFWQAAAARWAQLSFPLTGAEKTGDELHLLYRYDSDVLYDSVYIESGRTTKTLADGTVQVEESLKHKTGTLYSAANPTQIVKENVIENFEPTALSDGKSYGIRNLKEEVSFSFSLGKFSDSKFTADEDTSLRGTIQVALKSDSSVKGEVDVVVGMEPFVLMDFEDHGDVAATEYWSCHVGPSSAGGSGQLLSDEVKSDRLWIRQTSGTGIVFPGDGNKVVSADEDENVRFGQYAFKIGYNFGGVSLTAVAAADFGFSGDLRVDTVQPTKIGMWIKVPADCEYGDSVLKAVLKGGAFEADLATSYMKFNEDGSISYVDGKQLNGTAAYVQYYSYNADGTVSGSKLSDWAGKDWTWVEADISAFQMPVDVARAYTVRVVSAQNCAKPEVNGYLYIDNLQFIYGTNTNDVKRPVLESVTETGSGTVLAGDGSTVLSSGTLTFSAVYSDSELTDKYATGIDQSGIRVLLDGADYTNQLEINEGSLYLKGVELRNGTHTLTIRLKDFYGNVTEETRTFRVEDAEGQRSAIDVLPQPEAPEIGKEYALSIVNNTGEPVTSAEITVDFSTMGNAAKYLEKATVEGSDEYELTLSKTEKQAKITIERKSPQRSLLARLFGAETAAAYDYVSELGYLVISIPADAAESDTLRYTVTKGSYTIDNGTESGKTYTFSGTEQEVKLTAGYQLSCEQAIVGMSTELTVTDADGNAVSRATIYQVNGADAPEKMGKTNMKGKLTHTFDTPGEYTFYAEKAGAGRSWNQRVIVCEKTVENGGKPFGILTNGVTEPGTKSITWLTQIDGSAAVARVRYSTNPDLSEAETVEGSSVLQTFVQSKHGDALRSNKVRLTGLQPGTTYYYQVGDGKVWSETESFTISNGKETNFFILGDIQSSDTSNLASSLEALKKSETSYDFAIQTGDAIDNVTNYDGNWRPFLTTVNSKTLGGVDMIHVMGNHEYYGDANGEISDALYDLPESAQNSWYKMEYGKVCVVAINNGTKLAETLADIAENLTTDCIWKVLVAHEPIYGTESVSATPEIISSIEKAGFDFVFGGDDHAYARTYPMIGGVKQAEDSRGGVVYYVCGDLSGKSNAFHEREEYVKAIPHNDYTGMYLTVEATEETFAVKAVKYDGTELDSYTETRTDCELGKHKVDAASKYDMSKGTITCTVCGEALEPTGEYAFSGLLSTTDGKQVILAKGSVKKNEFSSMGEDRYHSCADGYAYVTTASDSRTCVTGGYITYTCPGCDTTDKSAFQMPVGHVWDDDYVCKVCKTKGIDIAGEEVVFKFGSPDDPRDLTPVPGYYYREGGVRPSSFAKYGDFVLTQSNDNNLINNRIPDLYVEWPDSKDIGEAEIECTGRGDYYGKKTLTYYIVPNDVTDLKCTETTEDSVTLTWSAAPGAGYYEVFRCNENNSSRQSVGTTEKTTLTVTGLTADMGYYFVAAGRTKVPTENNKVYNSAKWSNVLYARTDPAPADVTSVAATVDGHQITLTEKGDAKYLFLPASADMTQLSLTFATEPASHKVMLSGNKGMTYLSDAVDVTAVAAVGADGYREITASVGKGKQPLTFRVMQASAIPTMYLTSSDAAQGRDWVDASKSNAATGTMNLIGADGAPVYSGELKQIKARGNSTFTYTPKKSYQIKLAEPSDLLGKQEQVKTWVLLASYFDATQMHDKLIKDLAAELGLAYTASCDWVNLYYDGEYRGVYLLSEKNSVGATSVAITDMEQAYEQLNEGYGTDMTTALAKNSYGQQYQYTKDLKEPENITGGYLIELNHDMWDEASGFKTRQGVAFNVKSPEWCGDSAMKYISEYYQAFEDAVYATDDTGAYTGYNTGTGKYFYEYVDMASLVKVFLLQELALNCDGFISSVYFYKDADGIMYAGPIWDQDMTFGTGWNKTNGAEIVDYHYLAEALIRIPAFEAAVKEYYTNTFASEVRDLLGSNGTIARQYALLKDNAAMNYTIWDYIRIGNPEMEGHIWQGVSYQGVVDEMTTWIEDRLANMDSRFNLQSTVAGDVNGDGEVDVADAIALLRYLAGYGDESTIPANGDFNGDGEVDVADAIALLRYLAGYTD